MKSTNYNVFLIFVAITFLLFASCTPKEKKITIIATNDIHGGIDNFPRLATLVEQYRIADSTHFLLVDAGDRWTGNPYVDINPNKGLPVIELLNSLRVDLATLGNHEFDFSLDTLTKRIGDGRYPIVAANINSNGSMLPQPKPYHTFTVDGVKICFMGLITTARGGYPDGFVKNFGSVLFSSPLATALEYRSLRDSCDVLVGLTHIGYDLDSVLAMQMPELDLIIGGHTHTVIPKGKIIGRSVVTQGGKSLKYVSVTTVTMQGKKIKNIENHLVKLDTIEANPKYEAMVESYKNRPELNQPKGMLKKSLNKHGVTNLAADIIRSASKSDLALYNWGGIRIDSLPAGKITNADIYFLEPFGNLISVVDMTLPQIKEMILTKFNSPGKEGRTLDLCPSGFTYFVLTNSKGNGVDVTFNMQAKPSPSGIYKVAMSDYVQSTYNFSRANTGVPTGIAVSSSMLEYFVNESPLDGDNIPRVLIGR